MNKTGILNIEEGVSYPNGFCISDNRIEDFLQRFISPSSYVIFRQLLRFWGANKTKAYPSLRTLSKRTGLSERTIRGCNEELVAKNFIQKNSGKLHLSNSYYYIPIEKILIEYYDTTDPSEKRKVEVEDRRAKLAKVKKPLDQLSDKERVFVEMVLTNFMEAYEEKIGQPYEVESNDVRAMIENATKLVVAGDLPYYLIDIFFETKNEYIQKSSYNLFLFFRPKIQKALLAEYHKSDRGRWEAQAKKLWEEARPKVEKLFDEHRHPESITDWINKNVKFSSANTDRDEFVRRYLTKAIKEFSKSISNS